MLKEEEDVYNTGVCLETHLKRFLRKAEEWKESGEVRLLPEYMTLLERVLIYLGYLNDAAATLNAAEFESRKQGETK